MKILILGATSAIAQETAKCFARDGAELFLVGRSAEKLEAVQNDLKVRGANRAETFGLDLSDLDRHQEMIQAAIETLDGLDMALVAHGTLGDQRLSQESVAKTLEEFTTNCTSVISLLTLLANYFEPRRRGCIAVISSVAGDRGRRSNYVYGAAKGALSIFLQGLRSRLYPAGVRVITIKPGPVDTPMTAHLRTGLTLAKPEVVARDIYRALENGSPDVLYTPRYWRYIMAAIRIMPERIFKRLSI